MTMIVITKNIAVSPAILSHCEIVELQEPHDDGYHVVIGYTEEETAIFCFNGTHSECLKIEERVNNYKPVSFEQ